MNRRDFIKKAGQFSALLAFAPLIPYLPEPSHLTITEIQRAVHFAKEKGIRPIMINGERYYVLQVHPYWKLGRLVNAD